MKGTHLTVEESVRLEAYLLSEKAGHPHGLETMFWTQAEAIVQGRVAAIAPSGMTKPTKAPAKRKTATKKAVPAAKPSDTQLLLAPEVPAAKAPAKQAAPPKAAKAKVAAQSPAKAAKVSVGRTGKK